MDLKTTLFTLMNEGGWVMWALLGFSIVSLGTAVERAIVLRRASLDSAGFVGALRRALKKQTLRDALSVANGAQGPAARVAMAGLRRFESPASQVEKSMERQAAHELRALRRGLSILATTATVAPLLGFLGTVTGMMASFEILGGLGISNPGAVAIGIKEALTTTAAGLTVAVPAQLLHNALVGRVERICGDIESVANFLLESREGAVS